MTLPVRTAVSRSLRPPTGFLRRSFPIPTDAYRPVPPVGLRLVSTGSEVRCWSPAWLDRQSAQRWPKRFLRCPAEPRYRSLARWEDVESGYTIRFDKSLRCRMRLTPGGNAPFDGRLVAHLVIFLCGVRREPPARTEEPLLGWGAAQVPHLKSVGDSLRRAEVSRCSFQDQPRNSLRNPPAR